MLKPSRIPLMQRKNTNSTQLSLILGVLGLCEFVNHPNFIRSINAQGSNHHQIDISCDLKASREHQQKKS